MSYQKLTSDEVFTLYETVTQALSVPLVVYDNPGTTHFEFDDQLHWRIAKLPNIGSIKIPALSADPKVAKQRVEKLRSGIPSHVTIGISGDAAAAGGLTAGCDVWYSVIGGLFPEVSLALTRLAQAGNISGATEASQQLEPLWAMFRQYGSLRVIATAAELLGHASAPCLPAPLKSLQGGARETLNELLDELGLA
jgi:4-hydroxy-tetrahydrodipicolinate synthase